MANNWSTILPVATQRLPAPPPHRNEIQPTIRIGIRANPRRHNDISIMEPSSDYTSRRAMLLIGEILLAGEPRADHLGAANALRL